MPRGYPDWGRIRKEVGITALGDLGELAVRLGSPIVWDRRGDVIFTDSFDLGLMGWDISNLIATASYELSVEEALHGGFSLKLDPGASAATSHRMARDWPDVGISKTGMEISFLFFSGFDSIDFDLIYQDGAKVFYFRLRYDYPEREIQIVNELDQIETVKSDVLLRPGEKTWHYLKIVADIEKREYLRGIVDRIEVNLTGKEPFSEPSTEAPGYGCMVEITSAATTFNVVYLDSFVFTQNEP